MMHRLDMNKTFIDYLKYSEFMKQKWSFNWKTSDNVNEFASDSITLLYPRQDWSFYDKTRAFYSGQS